MMILLLLLMMMMIVVDNLVLSPHPLGSLYILCAFP